MQRRSLSVPCFQNIDPALCPAKLCFSDPASLGAWRSARPPFPPFMTMMLAVGEEEIAPLNMLQLHTWPVTLFPPATSLLLRFRRSPLVSLRGVESFS